MRTSVTKQDAHHNGKFIAVDVLACQNVIYLRQTLDVLSDERKA
ncbi:hypothetical protein ACM974_003508 [Salmonella enterica]